jgi:hypothetical protein
VDVEIDCLLVKKIGIEDLVDYVYIIRIDKLLTPADRDSRTSQVIAARVNEGMIPVEQVEEGINVAAPSVASLPLKTVTSAEGDTKCKEVIVSFEQDANVAGLLQRRRC